MIAFLFFVLTFSTPADFSNLHFQSPHFSQWKCISLLWWTGRADGRLFVTGKLRDTWWQSRPCQKWLDCSSARCLRSCPSTWPAQRFTGTQRHHSVSVVWLFWWLGCCNSRVSDLWSNGFGFDSRSLGHYQVVTTWMGDCLPGLSVRMVGLHVRRQSAQGQLSLSFLWYQPIWLGLRWGMFTCVRWQVILWSHMAG